MNEQKNQPSREKNAPPKPHAEEPKRKELTPVRDEELSSIEGGACALMRIPPYWRCW